MEGHRKDAGAHRHPSWAIEHYGPQKGHTTDRKRVTLRTAKGSHHGPPKGHTTDRKRVISRTATGSPRTERSQHGPKRPYRSQNTSRHLSHGYLIQSCGATCAPLRVVTTTTRTPFTISTTYSLTYVSRRIDTYPRLRWHDNRGYTTLSLETC